MFYSISTDHAFRPTNTNPSTGILNISSTESFTEKHSTEGSTSTGEHAKQIAEKPRITHPARPGYGTRGTPTSLFANYFKLSISKDLRLYCYSITVPDLSGKRLSQIIKNTIEHTEFDSLRPFIATDFSAFLVSRKELPPYCRKLSVPMATRLNADDMSEGQNYAVSFDLVREYDCSRLENSLANLADHENLAVVQDLDIVLGHHRKSSPEVAAVGKRKAFSLTDSDGGSGLNDVLEALRGYFCSVRIGGIGVFRGTDEISPMVNINVTNSPFWKQASLLEVFTALKNDSEINITKISALLRGLRVKLSHMGDKTVTRTISGFAHANDGHGYMVHPPKVKDTLGPGPRKVEFYLEDGPRKDKDQEGAVQGKVKPHQSNYSCKGRYVSVAKYFEDSTSTSYHIPSISTDL